MDASTVFSIALDLAQSIRLRARPNLLLGPQANFVIFCEWSHSSTSLHLAREFQVQKLTLADGTTRTEKEIENEIDVEQLRASGLRPELVVRRYSY